MEVVIQRSSNPEKKYDAIIDGRRKVSFGAQGMEDFTTHHDPIRKVRYLARHGGQNQDWTRSGLETAGFYARNLLWNKPTLRESVADLNSRYKDVRFVLKI
jgi:hypothetical protein